jgi:hypothetical protein
MQRGQFNLVTVGRSQVPIDPKSQLRLGNTVYEPISSDGSRDVYELRHVFILGNDRLFHVTTRFDYDSKSRKAYDTITFFGDALECMTKLGFSDDLLFLEYISDGIVCSHATGQIDSLTVSIEPGAIVKSGVSPPQLTKILLAGPKIIWTGNPRVKP